MLSGPPSSRKVSLVHDTTEAALVQRVRSVLLAQPGRPMTTSELKLRLRASGGFVPGLVSLLRTHADVFDVEGGTVQLVEDAGASRLGSSASGAAASSAESEEASSGGGREPADGDDDVEDESNEAVGTMSARAPAAMPVRLHALGLPSAITTAGGGDSSGTPVSTPLASIREVILLDLDNRALLAFEAAARRALAADAEESVLVLAFCSTHHNPRLPRPTADALVRLAEQGRLRVLTPLRDRPNAADFVLTFWVGWLHACTHPDCRFVLVSEDVSLDQTVCDLLKGQGRAVSTLEGLGHQTLPPAAPRERTANDEDANGGTGRGR